MNNKGFTLIELVLVVTILGVIAVLALPSFTNVATEAERSSRDAVEGAVQVGLQIYRSNDMMANGSTGTYPSKLDDQAAGTPCAPATPCFGGALMSPVGDYRNGRGWTKVNDITYSFNDGSASYTYNYSSVNGTFTRQ